MDEAQHAAPQPEFVGEKEPTVLELLKRIDASLQLLTMVICEGLEQEEGED